MIKNIVVSIAGGMESFVTAKYAIYLAKILQAKLTAVYVVDEKTLQELLKARVFVEIEADEYKTDLEQEGRYSLDRMRALAQSKNVEFEGVILKGCIHEEVINKAIELKADLLVMGGFKDVLSWKDTYSEGERIFREYPNSILVVRNTQEAEKLYREVA